MAGAVERGARGEQLAGQYLEARGYAVVMYNYRSRYGEIDVVLESEEYLVFLEVKLRKSGRYGYGAEFVGAGKQKRLRLTAELYLRDHPTALQPRFDVLEIYAPDGTRAPLSFRHIIDAF